MERGCSWFKSMGSEVDSRSMVGRKIVDLLIRVQFPSVHLIASLGKMNVIWNKNHDNHILTLDEIKRIINEELDKGWRFLEKDIKKYRGENELD